MASIGAAVLSVERSGGIAFEVSPDRRAAAAGLSECRDPSIFSRRARNNAGAGYSNFWFGARVAAGAEPSVRGVLSHGVLVVVMPTEIQIQIQIQNILVTQVKPATGCRLAPSALPAESHVRAWETFTIRLERTARVLYYMLRGTVSPVVFPDIVAAARVCGVSARRRLWLSTSAWIPRLRDVEKKVRRLRLRRRGSTAAPRPPPC
jgi:hypothetical protein